MEQFHVAIDGPAGSGKSTISQNVSNETGWQHIDTGAMYRAVTYWALKLNLNLADENSYEFLNKIDIKYLNNKVFINDIDLSSVIRSDDVTQNVSLVSKFSFVRKKLVEIQQNLAKNKNIIMDGRDIGTVVLPNANLKIFLTANIKVRAKRRYNEKLNNGQNVNLDELINNINTRDKKDSSRIESPLKIADDAVIIDTTYLSIRQVVEKIIEMIERRRK